MGNATRTTAYGEEHRLTVVDRAGVWLSQRAIRRTLGTSSGMVLADVGCGYHARFAMSRYPTAARVVLADVSLAPNLVRLDRVTGVVGPLPASLAAVPTGSVDHVVMNSVLEHLDDPVGTLVELRRIAHPDRGVVFVNVPSWRGKRALELSAFRLGLSPAAEIDDHRRYYDRRALWQHLRDAGFLPSRIHIRGHKLGLNLYAVCRPASAPQ